MWFSVVCGLALLWTHSAVPCKLVHNILAIVMIHASVYNKTDNTKPHLICVLPQCESQRKCFWELGIVRHIDTSSAGWTLAYSGKLANQIAKSVPIVVKSEIDLLTWLFCLFCL
mgnify:FL=1